MLVITISGPQGCGKSTLVGILADDLAARGFSVELAPGTETNEVGEPDDIVLIEEKQA